MLERRVQILLDEERYRRVAATAAARGVSLAAVIREAIDHVCPAVPDRRAAVAAILAAEPMAVPHDPADLRRELDLAHGRTAP